MDNEIKRLLDWAEADKNNSSVSFAEHLLPDSEEARKAFSALKLNVRDINSWNKAAVLNNFKLFGENGSEQKSPIFAENIFIRMSLKGSGKYDWIKVIKINERENAVIVTVKPTFNPTDEDPGKAQTSHFFTAESTNNFCLQKDSNKISFYVIGLNERQNISEVKGTLEMIRNAATANIGSYLGIQKAEWNRFCNNFLDLR